MANYYAIQIKRSLSNGDVVKKSLNPDTEKTFWADATMFFPQWVITMALKLYNDKNTVCMSFTNASTGEYFTLESSDWI